MIDEQKLTFGINPLHFQLQQVEDQEANEGRSAVIDVLLDASVVEVKAFLKQAQQIRDKVVNIENLVTQIRTYHGKIYGAASRNEGK